MLLLIFITRIKAIRFVADTKALLDSLKYAAVGNFCQLHCVPPINILPIIFISLFPMAFSFIIYQFFITVHQLVLFIPRVQKIFIEISKILFLYFGELMQFFTNQTKKSY